MNGIFMFVGWFENVERIFKKNRRKFNLKYLGRV